MSIPVVIAKNGLGTPVRPVDKGAPAMTVAGNGFGAPIVISDLGAPFVVSGLFNIDDLFANGESGVWFEPSPSTCFTDEAGTIPATVGDPVALMLDKSGNGYHATQPTTSAQPTLGRVPETGRRNLLEWTEDFGNAVWSKTRSYVTDNVLTAPDGTLTAGMLVENTSTSTTHFMNTRVYALTDNVGVRSIFLKAGGRKLVSLGHGNASLGAYFDLENGVVVRAVGPGVTADIEDHGNGWFRCSIRVPAAQSTDTNAHLILMLTDNTDNVIYTGDGVSGVYMWHPQAELGEAATPYQKVTSQYDVTEDGVKSLNYLSFDGVDDFMETTEAVDAPLGSAIFFGGYAGMGTDTVHLPVFGWNVHSSHGGVNSVALRLRPSSEIFSHQFRARTSVIFALGYNDLLNKTQPFVASGVIKDSPSGWDVRLDGVEISSSRDPSETFPGLTGQKIGIQGTGQSLAMFSAIAIAKAPSEQEIENTEQYIAKKTGVTM